ncbi:MAG: hypothetical protein GY772_20770 [bacterium]|jgi:hypothetical protein|nr:hypothetical protein [bacterium]
MGGNRRRIDERFDNCWIMGLCVWIPELPVEKYRSMREGEAIYSDEPEEGDPEIW